MTTVPIPFSFTPAGTTPVEWVTPPSPSPPWVPCSRGFGGPSSRPSSRSSSRPPSRGASSRPPSRTAGAVTPSPRALSTPRASPVGASPAKATASPRVTAASTRPPFPEGGLALLGASKSPRGRASNVLARSGGTPPIAPASAAPFLKALGLPPPPERKSLLGAAADAAAAAADAAAPSRYWPERLFSPDMFGVTPRDTDWDRVYASLQRMRTQQARAQHDDRMGRIYG